MKVVLYMATTIDGFVAKKNGDSDWVSPSDTPIFEEKIKEAGCIVMGRRTYEVSGSDFPYKGALNIVMTSNGNLKSNDPNVLFLNKHPKDVIEVVKKKGFQTLLIIGGGNLNGSFLKEGLIDEIYIDIHPLVLGSGIKLFEKCEVDVKLKLLDIKPLKNDLILLRYKVLK